MAARVNLWPDSDSAVHVWVAQLPDSPCHSGVEDLLAPLPEHLAVRLARFQQGQDLLLRLGGLTLLAHGLHSLVGLDSATSYAALHYDPHGRPFLSSSALTQLWQVSFSYAYPWVACALGMEHAPVQASFAPHAGLGIDMEGTEGTSPLCTGPVTRFAHVFTPAEQQAIAMSPDASNALVQYWTIKEAVLKALGAGFGLNPHSIDTCPPSGSARVRTRLHRGTQCSTTQQMLYSLNYDGQWLFWQSCALSQSWLTIAALSPWQHTEISFLRLAQKGHTLLLL